MIKDGNVTTGPFRPLVIASKMPDAEPTVWDEAHSLISQYEKNCEKEKVPRIFIIVDSPELAVGHIGEKCRPSDAAGLFLLASTMVLGQTGYPDPKIK